MEKSIKEIMKTEAIDTPQVTRNRKEVLLPKDFVKELATEIEKRKGSFSIKAKVINDFFGWKPKYPKNGYLKAKLNKQYPLDTKDQEWHVRTINNGDLYAFEYRKVTTKKEE